MASKTKEEIESAKSYDMVRMLEQLGIQVARDKKICCPFHTEKTPSASIGNRNLLNCFGCGVKNVDTIKLYMHIKGVDFPAAIDEINQLAGTHFEPSTLSSISNYRNKSVPSPKESYKNFLKFFKPYSALDSKKKVIVDNYLNERQLTDAHEFLLKNRMQVGIDTRGHVCWHLRTFGIVVAERKMNMGSPVPILLKVSSNNTWYITEGMTDALTACQMGYNAISLNSVENLQKLLELLSSNEKSKKFKYVIATDTDAVGQKAMGDLIRFFMQNNYKYSRCTELYSSSYKDLNEMYVENCKLKSNH